MTDGNIEGSKKQISFVRLKEGLWINSRNEAAKIKTAGPSTLLTSPFAQMPKGLLLNRLKLKQTLFIIKYFPLTECFLMYIY